MTSRPKRKFVTSREREILLQQFYDDIEENKEQFLGHAFVGDEDNDTEFVQRSDSEVQADDNNEEKSGTVDDAENFDGDNIVIREQEELTRKQKFLMKAIMLIYQCNQCNLAFFTQMQGKL